ncbi:MAG: TDG/mug DNA glycosylase family protein [Planctomycetota bacterium]
MTVANVSSFLPVARNNARVLILGSMPGIASLEAQRYYAHPRNAFWPILAEICGFDRELPYEQRLEQVQFAGIALWDVLASCAREGSLDSDIESASIRTNDFAGFLGSHPDVTAVFCNGGAAFQMFRKRVVPELSERFATVIVRQLPSSSPAHASMTLAQKRDVWLREIGPLLA